MTPHNVSQCYSCIDVSSFNILGFYYLFGISIEVFYPDYADDYLDLNDICSNQVNTHAT